MKQIPFDFTALPTFKIGCRVDGEIQQYEIEAVDHLQARQFVEEGVPGANPILVRVK